MIVETAKIETLKPDPGNVRRHDPANIDALKRSLKEFGQQKPIVVDTKNVVIAGNGFLEAAKQLGWKTIQVVRTALTGDKARAYAVADNRTAELSDWDVDALARLLQSLPDDYVRSTGWDEEEIEAMAGQVAESYKPILDPQFGARPVTDDQVSGAGDVFDVAQPQKVKVNVTCPHCGRDFSIDPIR